MDEPGRVDTCGARVWGGTEEAPAEVDGRPVCWLDDCPAGLPGRSGPDGKGSVRPTAFDLWTGSKLHW